MAMAESVSESASKKVGLFEPLDLGGVKICNRIVVPPMCMYSASPDAEMQDFHMFQYAEYAVGGVGLVFVEASAICPEGRISNGCIGVYNDANIPKFKQLTSFVHDKTQSKIGIQLIHAGRKAGWTKFPWSGDHRPLTIEEGGWTPLAPSPLTASPAFETPKEMTKDDIERVKADFVKAAVRAVECGFAVIELHGAHGYLIHEFLSPISNARTDEYGGSLENRMRFALEVTEAVRAAIPAEVPLTMRLSATDWIEGGWDLEQTVELCKALKTKGLSFFDISTGGIADHQSVPAGPGFQVPFATRIRDETGLPVICVGMITGFDQAEKIVEERKADMVALGREILRNPRWPHACAEHFNVDLQWMPQHVAGKPHTSRQLQALYAKPSASASAATSPGKA